MTAFMATIYSKKMIRKNISLKLFKNKLGKYISMQPIYLQYTGSPLIARFFGAWKILAMRGIDAFINI